MGSVPYLEGYDVIDRANSIFGFTWSFDLLGEPVIVRWQKKVLIWNQQEKRRVPSLDANGNSPGRGSWPGVHHRKGDRRPQWKIVQPRGSWTLRFHRRYPGGSGHGA